jgi:serine/threonine protein kinase
MPTIINSRYEIRGVVGRGGMGLVYKAFDRIVGRDVAVKTLVDIQGRAALDAFYKEWRLLANLHHPNIIEIFDIGEFEEDGIVKPFFVMPLLPGMPLDQLVRTPGQKITAERFGEILSQVCRGLQAIHDSGLVHRDIKPSNIFVMDFNSVKLIDFGVAHLMGGNTMTELKGTVAYMAPEQIQSQGCSPASDIFSLGVVAYEVLCGIRPFHGKQMEEVFEAILHHSPQPIFELNPTVSQMVSRVVHKALAKQPRHRYANAIEFAEMYQRALRGEAIPIFDPARIQPRIDRAVRAFEQGNPQMAMDILNDLDASGHIDPALVPLRNRVDEALRRQNIRDLLDRAKLALEEEEFALAAQNTDAILKMEPDNAEALKLSEAVRAEVSRRELDEALRNAEATLRDGSYERARQLLKSALESRPDEPRAQQLLAEIDAAEQAYRAALQEKESLYRAAREAWQNSEFSAAAIMLKRVVELETKAPDSKSPDSGTNYSSLLSLVEHARTVVSEVHAKCLQHIAEGHFQNAAELCRKCAEKYPGHPVPQGLRLITEAAEQRSLFVRLTQLVQTADTRNDCAGTLEALEKANAEFPAPPAFDRWLNAVREQLALAQAVEAKARAHEGAKRYQQALDEWQMLALIDPQRAGLDAEIDRVARLAGAAAYPSAVERPKALAMAVAAGPQDQTLAFDALAKSAAAGAGKPAGAAGVAPNDAVSPKPSGEESRAGGFASRIVSAGQHAARFMKSPVFSRTFTVGRWTVSFASLAAGIGFLVLLVAIPAIFMLRDRRERPPASGPQSVPVSIRSVTPGAVIRVGNETRRGEFRAELQPGDYPLEVRLAGYEAVREKIIVPASGLTMTLPELRPFATSLHISADLQKARVRVDDRPESPMEDSDFQADDLAAGDHQVVITDGRSQATIAFSTAPAKAPQIKSPVGAKELVALVATALGSTVTVHGSVEPTKVTVDGREARNEAGAFQAGELPEGEHEIAVVSGKDERKFAIHTGDRPEIRVALYSDRDVGSIVISTGLPDFRVFIDGVAYTRKIRDGSMFIGSLPAKSYKVRVAADGYQPGAEQVLEVKKGGLVKQAFALTAIPQFGTLVVKGAPPRTQVLIDNSAVGTTDAEGSLTIDKVSPGEHTVELRNPPQYKPAQFRRTFGSSESIAISGAEARLERNAATIVLTATPDGVHFETRCGQGSPQRRPAPVTVTCGESQFSYRATLEGYREVAETITLSPGETYRKPVELTKVIVAVKKNSCGMADLPKRGWTLDQGWYAAGNEAVLPCEDMTGTYQFAVRLPRGFAARPVNWTIQSGSARHQFVLEKKSFSFRGGQKQDISKYDEDGHISFRLINEGNRVIHEVKAGNSWERLFTNEGDFRKSKVIFSKDARIAAFMFNEH